MDDAGAGSCEHSPCLAERLSIVLLTYNCAHRVDTVLDRLVELGLPIIAVDNASSDGTVDVLRARRATRLEVVALPDNVGAAGRNIGVDHVQTPYVAFCDDDGWYDALGLLEACDLLDRHSRLALLNARILVGEGNRLDPISAEMAASPLVDRDGIPGGVLLGFMAGACLVRVSAFRDAGGYDPRFFMGGEEEPLALRLAQSGWQLRYAPWVVVHHHPSLANYQAMRPFGMRNTLWAAWLNRRLGSALRYTAFVLGDSPKGRGYVRALRMALAGTPWVVRERRPMSRQLNGDLRQLDARRYASRRRFLTFREGEPVDPNSWPAEDPVLPPVIGAS